MFFICMIFASLSAAKLLADIIGRVYNTCFGKVKDCVGYSTAEEEGESRKFCYMSSSWFLMLLNCVIVMFIISL